MKFIISMLVILAAAFCQAAPVQPTSVHYTISASFSATTPSGFFTEPGEVFTLSFTVPDTALWTESDPKGLYCSTVVPVDFSLGAVSFTDPLGVFYLYDISYEGGCNVKISNSTDTIEFSLPSGQLFSGNVASPVLLTGTFPLNFGSTYTGYSLNRADLVAFDKTSGFIAAEAVPEPAMAALFAVGVGGAVLLRRWRCSGGIAV